NSQLGSVELLSFPTPSLWTVVSVVTFATHAGLREAPPSFNRLQNFTRRRNEIMKTTKLVMLVMTIAVTLFILIPNMSWAARSAAKFQQVAKLHKEKKRNHEDDKAGDAGNDNRGDPVHPDSQSVMGC